MACRALAKLSDRVDRVNSLLCVGLDTDLSKLPPTFLSKDYPQFEFNKWIIDQTHEFVCTYKPNVAFYEAQGSKGLNELEMTIKFLREKCPDVLTILDAKRADIGNTNTGYVTSILDNMGFDAMTINPYLGSQALAPFLARADKGLIVLCRTSNPGAGELQDLLVDGEKPLWQVVAEKATNEWNENGNIMLVVGATYPKELKKIREIAGDMTFLVPGIGAQGGNVEATVKAGVNSQGKGMIINLSRGIIFNNDPQQAAKEHRDKINEHR